MGRPTRVTNQIRRLRFDAGKVTRAERAERIGVTRHRRPPRPALSVRKDVGHDAAAHHRARRSGKERVAILGYYEDGPNLVTMALNGWGEPEPAWWLNLQANQDTIVKLPDGPRAVRGRAATPEERPR